MNDYTVLKAFESHDVGDTLSLNPRQAKFLLTGGLIKVKKQDAVVTLKKTEKGE